MGNFLAERMAEVGRGERVVVDFRSVWRLDNLGDDIFAVAFDIHFLQTAAFDDREHGGGPCAAIF